MNILEYTFSRTPLQELSWQASLRFYRNLHRNPPPCLYQWRYHPCLVWRHRHRSVCRHQPHPVCNDICHTQRFRRTMDFLTQGHTSGLRHCHVLDSGHECGHHLLFPYSRFHARPAIFLFGSILTIGTGDLWLLGILTAFVCILFTLFYDPSKVWHSTAPFLFRSIFPSP